MPSLSIFHTQKQAVFGLYRNDCIKLIMPLLQFLVNRLASRFEVRTSYWILLFKGYLVNPVVNDGTRQLNFTFWNHLRNAFLIMVSLIVLVKIKDLQLSFFSGYVALYLPCKLSQNDLYEPAPFSFYYWLSVVTFLKGSQSDCHLSINQSINRSSTTCHLFPFWDRMVLYLYVPLLVLQ